MRHKCRVCGEGLVKGRNWFTSSSKRGDYICKSCFGVRKKKRRAINQQNKKNKIKTRFCRICGKKLVKGENWCDKSHYICKPCFNASRRKIPNEYVITSVKLLRDKCNSILKDNGSRMGKRELYKEASKFFGKNHTFPYSNFVGTLKSDKDARFVYEDGQIRLRTESELLEMVEEGKLIIAGMGAK